MAKELKQTLDENFEVIEEKTKHKKQVRKSIYLKTLNNKNYDAFKKMGYSDTQVISYQKGTITQSLVFGALGFVAGTIIFKSPKISLIAFLVVAIFMFYVKTKAIQDVYTSYRFERELQFAKFTRILTPYLVQLKQGKSLYGMLNKVLPRLDNEKDKRLLRKLMKDMTDHPNSVRPFTDFSESFSGSDAAVVFMSAVFDMKTGSTDEEVVLELSKEANEELIKKIREIRTYKVKKFAMGSTKTTLTAMFLLFGEIIALILASVSQMNF